MNLETTNRKGKMSEPENILDKLDIDRIADDLWTLVNIPSPTGSESEILDAYAVLLEKAGAEIQREEGAVIGRLRGLGGETFQLAGHADHIDMPHAAPSRSGEMIGGRGSADMKGGLAAILEIVRVFSEQKNSLRGDLLITVYGGHEAPVGDSAALNGLIQQGIVGNAAMVVESAEGLEDVVVCGAGQSIWNLSARWEGRVCHELRRPRTADGVWDTTIELLRFLRGYERELRTRENRYSLLRPESVFVGQLHGGDFYNRTTSDISIQGTRRWHPNRDFRSIKEEFRSLLEEQAKPSPEVSIGVDWNFVGESYEVSPDEKIVIAQTAACRKILGSSRLSGTMVVTDAARLARLGRVPTVVCAFDNETAHADQEYVRLPRILESCQVALLTVMNFFESGNPKNG